jgi:hypothetical protein
MFSDDYIPKLCSKQKSYRNIKMQMLKAMDKRRPDTQKIL